jgi:hypothetical protein
MFARVIKYVGFGMVVAGLQDEALDFSEASEKLLVDCAVALVGLVCWGLGNYFESRAPVALQTPANSTELIKKVLRYGAGAGVASGIMHLAKHTNTNSSGMSDINTGAVLFIAANEFNLIATQGVKKVKWEKLRFAIVALGDYFTASGFKKYSNGEPLDLYSKITLPIGLAMVISEYVYMLRNDAQDIIHTRNRCVNLTQKMNIVNRLNCKRLIKLTLGLGTIFALQDIIFGERDKYSLLSDGDSIIASIMLFIALMEMRRLANALNNRDALLVNFSMPRIETSSPMLYPALPDAKAVDLNEVLYDASSSDEEEQKQRMTI